MATAIAHYPIPAIPAGLAPRQGHVRPPPRPMRPFGDSGIEKMGNFPAVVPILPPVSLPAPPPARRMLQRSLPDMNKALPRPPKPAPLPQHAEHSFAAYRPELQQPRDMQYSHTPSTAIQPVFQAPRQTQQQHEQPPGPQPAQLHLNSDLSPLKAKVTGLRKRQNSNEHPIRISPPAPAPTAQYDMIPAPLQIRKPRSQNSSVDMQEPSPVSPMAPYQPRHAPSHPCLRGNDHFNLSMTPRGSISTASGPYGPPPAPIVRRVPRKAVPQQPRSTSLPNPPSSYTPYAFLGQRYPTQSCLSLCSDYPPSTHQEQTQELRSGWDSDESDCESDAQKLMRRVKSSLTMRGAKSFSWGSEGKEHGRGKVSGSRRQEMVCPAPVGQPGLSKARSRGGSFSDRMKGIVSALK